MSTENSKKMEIEKEDDGASTKKKNVEPIGLSFEQYFDRYCPNVHKYTRAFISVNYYGIIKTKEEWEKELTGKY